MISSSMRDPVSKDLDGISEDCFASEVIYGMHPQTHRNMDINEHRHTHTCVNYFLKCYKFPFLLNIILAKQVKVPLHPFTPILATVSILFYYEIFTSV